jgi:hypothetical protein
MDSSIAPAHTCSERGSKAAHTVTGQQEAPCGLGERGEKGPAEIAEIALIGKGVEKSASDGGPHLPSQIALIADIGLVAARRSQKPLSEIALIRAASRGYGLARRVRLRGSFL